MKEKKREKMTVGGSTRREDKCRGWGRQEEEWVEAGGSEKEGERVIMGGG